MKSNPILILIICLVSISFSQTTGKIKGVVLDESGDPLPYTNVTVEGTTLGAETDQDGYYYIIGVRPGTYTIKAQFVGYGIKEMKNVKVRVGLTTTQNFGLKSKEYDFGEIKTETVRSVRVLSNTAAAYKHAHTQRELNANSKLKHKKGLDSIFSNHWKGIHNTIKHNQPKSLLSNLNSLYQVANSKGSDINKIKTYLYKELDQLKDIQAEDELLNNMRNDLIRCNDSVFRSIYHYLIAKKYSYIFDKYNYYIMRKENNDLYYSDRIPDFLKETSIKELIDSCAVHYELALKDRDILKKVKLTDLEDIFLIYDQYSNSIRETLYEFITVNTIEFYSKNILSIPYPKVKFELKEEDLFGKPKVFNKIDVSENYYDEKNFKGKALKLYQELTKYYLDVDKTESLLDLTLSRLVFVRDNYERQDNSSTIADSIYLNSLENLYNEYKFKTPFYTKLAHILASKYYSLKKYSESLDICNEVLKADSNNVYLNIHDLKFIKEKILKPEMNVSTLSTSSTYEHNRAVVQYRNIDHLFYRIYNTELYKGQIYNYEENKKKSDIPQNIFYYKEKNINYNILKDQKEIFKGKKQLESKCFALNSHEIVLPKLTPGNYSIMFYHDENNIADSSAVISNIKITDLNYVTTGIYNNGKRKLEIINRINGKCVPNARIDIAGVQNRFQKTADGKGICYLDQLGITYSYYSTEVKPMIKIVTETDSVYLDFNGLDVYRGYDYRNRIVKSAYVFTDKPIYKPGDKLYYKGIIIENHPDSVSKNRVLDNKEVIVSVERNNIDIYNKVIKTNQFGSFSGEIDIPENMLTGNFYIYISLPKNEQSYYNDRLCSKNIRLEEYKKPNFNITMVEQRVNYIEGDSILVEGTVKSLAGFGVGNCIINYEKFIDEKFDSKGEVLSENNGKFSFKFATEGDWKKEKYQYGSEKLNYRIKIKATDMNGESQMTSRIYYINKYKTELNLDQDEAPFTKSNRYFKYGSSININKNTPDSVNLNCKTTAENNPVILCRVYKIRKTDKNNYRKRILPDPKTVEISKSKYTNFFPFDKHPQQIDPEIKYKPYYDWDWRYYWQSQKELHALFTSELTDGKDSFFSIVKKDSIEFKDIIKFSFNDLNPGEYLVKFSSEDALDVYSKLFVYMQDEKTPYDDPFLCLYEDISYYSGDTASVYLSSDFTEKIRCNYILEKDSRIIDEKIFYLDQKIKKLEIPVTQEYQGGLTASFSIFYNNMEYKESVKLSVPWETKVLDVKLTTFRPELTTGEKEEWSLNISNINSQSEDTELILTMYDSSLEEVIKNGNREGYGPEYLKEFLKRYWEFYEYPYYTNGLGFNSDFTINVKRSEIDFTKFRFFEPATIIKHNELLNNRSILLSKDFQALRSDSLSYNFGSLSAVIFNVEKLNVFENEYYRSSSSNSFEFNGISINGQNESSFFRIPYLLPGRYHVTNGRNNREKFLEFEIFPGKETRMSYVIDNRYYDDGSGMVTTACMAGPERPDIFKKDNQCIDSNQKNSDNSFGRIPLRKDFRENVFFYPHLRTDSTGNINFKFTMPERITKWKLIGLAHTKDLKHGYVQAEVSTLKTIDADPRSAKDFD
jgi:hypothetical protein